ncbi:MAG: RC-LH1 core complex protein PufX [Pseudomonadota bacterium]
MKLKSRDLLFDENTTSSDLQIEILSRMAYGAALAGVLIGGVVGTIVVLWFIGTLLPEESRFATDPTPDSFVSEPAE